MTNAVLQSITITPPIPPATTVTIATKTNQQFTATGHFDNGTTQDLTQLVTWSTSDTTIATISNATSTKGVATGANPGTITIAANFRGISGSTSLNVVKATLTGITNTAGQPATISVGSTQQFAAIGTYQRRFHAGSDQSGEMEFVEEKCCDRQQWLQQQGTDDCRGRGERHH